MFDRVIAGFDGYDGGRDAIALATRLRPQHLIVVMAYGPQTIIAPSSVLDYWDDLRDDAKRRLAAACAELGVEAELHVVADTSPARALHHAAEQHRADLLVVGSAHRGPVGRLLVGDVAAGVLHDAPCPVAVAPKRLRDAGWSPARIGVGYDGREESRAALAAAAGLAGRLDAALLLCTAWEEPVFAAAAYLPELPRIAAETEAHAQEVVDAGVAAAGVPAEGRIAHGHAINVLRDLSEEVDLLVVGSRGWGTGGRVLLGTTVHGLAHRSRCPLVVVPRPVAAEPDGAVGARPATAARS
jgi:nucleotide-binding universal stress UspA family protein